MNMRGRMGYIYIITKYYLQPLKLYVQKTATEVLQGNLQTKRCIKDVKRVATDGGGCRREQRDDMETQAGRGGLEGTMAMDGVPKQRRSPRISDDQKQERGEERARRIHRCTGDFCHLLHGFLIFSGFATTDMHSFYNLKNK